MIRILPDNETVSPMNSRHENSISRVTAHDPELHSRAYAAGATGALPEAQDTVDCSDAILILERLSHAVLLTATDGKILYLNRRAESILDASLETVRGTAIEAALQPLSQQIVSLKKTQTEAAAPFAANLRQLEALDGRMPETDSTHPALELRITQLPDVLNGQGGYIYEIQDVSQNLRQTQQLMYEANHDPLTGLPNRRVLKQRLTQALSWEHEAGAETVLAMVDLDGFKAINDQCGHLAGDDVLREIAGILQNAVRKSDLVVRLGGDEFALMLAGCGLQEARRLLEVVRSNVEAYRYLTESHHYGLSASIGLVALDEEVCDISQALRLADQACYRAKYAGGNRLVVHTRPWARTPVTPAPSARAQLRAAQLPESDAGAHLQQHPILSWTGEPDVVERYEIRVSKPLDAAQADEHDAVAGDRRVLQTLLQNCAEDARAAGGKTLEFFVGISRASLFATDSVMFIRTLLRTHAHANVRICLNIAERDVIECRRKVVDFMACLRPYGVRFAIDGIGNVRQIYTLGYLKGLSVEYLRLHADTVRRMADNSLHHTFVDALNELSDTLQATLIGVNVDNRETLRAFIKLGIALVQGTEIGVFRTLAGDTECGQDESGLQGISVSSPPHDAVGRHDRYDGG